MSLKDFLSGFARLFDLGATLSDPELRRIVSQTDEEAIRSDWETVGKDMESVRKIFEKDW